MAGIRSDLATEVARATAAEVAGGAAVPVSDFLLPIHIDLAALGNGTLVSALLPGIKGQLMDVQFLVTEALVGSTKTVDIQLWIGSTQVTGGVTTVASANAAVGTVVAGSAITALNAIAAAGSLTVKIANATAFTSGKGTLYVRFRPVV